LEWKKENSELAINIEDLITIIPPKTIEKIKECKLTSEIILKGKMASLWEYQNEKINFYLNGNSLRFEKIEFDYLKEMRPEISKCGHNYILYMYVNKVVDTQNFDFDRALYIGKTNNLYIRHKNHYNQPKLLFDAYLNMLGLKSFDFYILYFSENKKLIENLETLIIRQIKILEHYLKSNLLFNQDYSKRLSEDIEKDIEINSQDFRGIIEELNKIKLKKIRELEELEIQLKKNLSEVLNRHLELKKISSFAFGRKIGIARNVDIYLKGKYWLRSKVSDDQNLQKLFFFYFKC
jgi:hypothetical protein